MKSIFVNRQKITLNQSCMIDLVAALLIIIFLHRSLLSLSN